MQTKIYFLIQCNIQILWQLITKVIKYLNNLTYMIKNLTYMIEFTYMKK